MALTTQQLSALKGQVGELRMTVEITRKDTGKVDVVELVGTVTDDTDKEQGDGSHAQHGG